MYSATHKMIAAIVHGHIQDELGVSLDLKAFKSGSIAPDIRLSMRTIKHNRKGSYDLVRSIGNGLIDNDYSTEEISMKEFSYKLGIIIHFVCDYFCTPHNNEKYKNIVKHLTYEKRLESFAFKKADWNIPSLNEAIVNNLWKVSSFEEVIMDKSKEYYETSKTSFSNDMEFAITVSTLTTLIIVRKALVFNRSNNIGVTGIKFMPA